MSAKNVTVTVASVVVGTAGYINWIQGTGSTYTVAVNAQTDYITVTDSATYSLASDTLWAAAGDLAYGTGNDTAAILSKGTAGQVLQIGASAPAWVNEFTDVTFASAAGAIATGTGAFRWYNKTGRTLTFFNVTLAVSVAPVTSAILVDVNVDGTTIFTTQGNRPTIAAAGFTGETTTFDVTTIATGAHYITVDIDQVGTGTTGSNLTTTIWMTG